MRVSCAADGVRGRVAMPLSEEPLCFARERYSGNGRVLNLFRCFLDVWVGIA